MTHKDYISSLGVIAIIGWAAWLLVLIKLEPCNLYSAKNFCENYSSLGLTLFFSSLFFALSASFAALGYLARIYLYNNEIFSSHLNISLRQGVLLSLCCICCLVLLSFGLLKWWSTILFFLMIIFVEFFFLNKEKS
jgi:hypothetical protein